MIPIGRGFLLPLPYRQRVDRREYDDGGHNRQGNEAFHRSTALISHLGRSLRSLGLCSRRLILIGHLRRWHSGALFCGLRLLCPAGALRLPRDTGLCVFLPLIGLRRPVRCLLAIAYSGGLVGVTGTGVRNASG
jgi:hypothetical protein